MEDDTIAALRNKALNSMPSKVSQYKMEGLLGRQEYLPRRSERSRRLTSPDITRDVLGAFGMKPSATRQYTRSKASRRSNHKSTRSSRSRSSETYSSYSSSSRSRSSSSSSGRSSYTRSSSYSRSSRSRSPVFARHSPPSKSRRKASRQDVIRSDKLLEHHHRKPRYAQDLPPPVEPYYYDSHSHRRMSKNAQYSQQTRKRPIERPAHVPYSKQRRPEHNDDYYDRSRHHMDRHKLPKPPPPRSPPPYPHRAPPPRPHRSRPLHERHHDGGGKYHHSKPSHVEPVPRYRNRSAYIEREDSSFSRRQPPSRPHHSTRRGNGHEGHASSSRNREIKERFIVVEESNFLSESSRKSSGKHHRKESPRRDREASPDSKQSDKPEPKSDLSDWEIESTQHVKVQVDPEPIDTELVSPDVKITGDDSFAEELDYNEDMDNLDVHPSELLDLRVDEALEEESSREKSQQSPSWSGEDSAKEDDDSVSQDSRSSSDVEDARPISSPLRVSPERSSDTREESWSGHGRVPVKQRLYLSKHKIEEKKRSAQYHSSKSSRSQSDLRPSLANRLGPPHLSRYGSQRGPRRDTPAKGSAMAIAEAYRKQKEAGKKVVFLRSQKGDKSGSEKGKETRKVNRL